MGSSEKHTITIRHENGDLTYDACNVRLRWGDVIEWRCEPRQPFAVHIGWDSPLRKGRYQSVDGNPIADTVPDGALPGRFKYFVAVFEDGKIWTDDPEFVVRRRS